MLFRVELDSRHVCATLTFANRLDGLGALAPVLRSLARTVATVLGQEQAA